MKYRACIGLLFASTILYATDGNLQQPVHIELLFFQHDASPDAAITSDSNPIDINTCASMYSYHSLEGIYLANHIYSAIQHATVSGPMVDQRIQHTLLKNYTGLLSPFNYWQHKNNYPLLSDHEKTLFTIKDKLTRRQLNTALLHVAWTVPAQQEQTLVFNDRTLSNDDILERIHHSLQGHIHITPGKNFDIKTEIDITESGKKQHFSASRRMKKNQLNYIDNERYGLLALVKNTEATY